MKFNFGLICNNVRGLRTSINKRQTLFQRFKEMVKHTGFVFMQETHSDPEIENIWSEEFGSDNSLIFGHGASNARGVCIGIVGDFGQIIKNKIIDPNGRFIIIELTIADKPFVIINAYNENVESQQVGFWDTLLSHMENICSNPETNIIIAGDFNLTFDMNLEAQGGNPTLKKNSIARFLRIKERFDLVDIWRIRNPSKKRFTFRQQHVTGFLQRRLDFLFISNSLQTLAKNVKIETAVMTDHSPLISSFKSQTEQNKRGANFWKYNTSLNDNQDYISKIESLIAEKVIEYNTEHITDKQIIWELLKYEIRKFTMKFSKELAREKKLELENLEQKLKFFEESNAALTNPEYVQTKANLEAILIKKPRVLESARNVKNMNTTSAPVNISLILKKEMLNYLLYRHSPVRVAI